MFRRAGILALVVLSLTVGTAFSQNGLSVVASTLAKDASREQRVGPGVTHISEFRSSGPLNFNVLRVDLANPDISIETEKPSDSLTEGARLADLGNEEKEAGHTVIGGVNGDFWAMTPKPYLPIGLFVSDGMIYNAPFARSIFALTRDGKPFLGVVSMKTRIRIGDESVEILRVNDSRSTDVPVLFTAPFGNVVPGSKLWHVALQLESPEFLPNQPAKARILGVSRGTSSPLRRDALVLALPPQMAKTAESMRKAKESGDDTVELLASVPEVIGVITYTVGGGPRLVRDGKVDVEYEEETMGRSFSYDRHPRTAIGLSADRKTLVLLTVDGRQPLVSIGQNLFELAEEMIRQGCSDAINLDGGGSTTMVVRGKVVNKPSDLKGPRTVANGVFVVSSAPTGSLSELRILPDLSTLEIPAGAPLRLRAEGFDHNFNPVDLTDAELVWTIDPPSLGELRPSGTTAELRTNNSNSSGHVIVQARGTTTSARLPVRLFADFDIVTDPETILLSEGESVDLRISALAEGKPLLLDPAMIGLSLNKPVVRIDGQTLTGITKGQTTLAVSVGTSSRTLPCYVDVFRASTLASWDDNAPTGMAGMNYDEKNTNAAISRRQKRVGSGSLLFNYSMTRGGTTKMTLPLDVEVRERPAKFALWIYGDGKEAWVRADVQDILGRRFLLDFTQGSKGVFWNGEWRHVMVPVGALTPRPSNPGATPEFPVRITEIYLAQDQEALKAKGAILLDDLQAIYPPSPGAPVQ